MKNFAAIGVFSAALAGSANAIIREDRLPLKTSTVTLDQSHQEHTTGRYGQFVHPFRQSDPDVQTIFYKDSKTMSKRLYRVAGPSRYDVQPQEQRAINKIVQQKKTKGIWETLTEAIFPTYGETRWTQQPMKNYDNLLYTGEIYLGTPLQENWVIWDTGSESLLVKSSACTACSGNVFDIDASSTFEYLDPAEYDSVRYLDGTFVEGQLGTDRACPVNDETACATFQFTAISDESGLRDYEDGIIGLWTGNYFGYDDTKLIMPRLHEAGVFEDNMFSFFLTGTSGDSYIDFGTPNPAAMSNPDDVIYIPIVDSDPWWTNYVSGFRWKAGDVGVTDTTEYSITPIKALTDTGSSCIIAPTGEANAIMQPLID